MLLPSRHNAKARLGKGLVESLLEALTESIPICFLEAEFDAKRNSAHQKKLKRNISRSYWRSRVTRQEQDLEQMYIKLSARNRIFESRLTIKLCLAESEFPIAYKKWKGKEAHVYFLSYKHQMKA